MASNDAETAALKEEIDRTKGISPRPKFKSKPCGMEKCVAVLHELTGTSAKAVFGTTDAMKLRSSLTLFPEASGSHLFEAAIERWFGDEKDEATTRIVDSLLVA